MTTPNLGKHKARQERNRRIVEMAMSGIPPREIRIALGGEITAELITLILTNARKEGYAIPRFPPIGKPRDSAPKPAKSPRVESLTPEDEALLKDRAARGIGLTSIAAEIRKPYRMIAEAMDRLKLARGIPAMKRDRSRIVP